MHTPQNIQSGYSAADFWAQWGSTTPRMCTCLLVTPKAEFGGSSAARGFTSNTRDMTLPGHPGITFYSTPGLSPSNIEAALDEPPNLEVMGIYQTGVITQAEVAAGKWNFAEVLLFSVCWNNVNLGEFWHVRGNLGKFTDKQYTFTAEIRGLISRLTNDVHEETGQLCRATFGDSRCTKDLTGTVTISGTTYNLTYTNTIPAATHDATQTYLTLNLTTATPDNYFANGKCVGTAGLNAGVSREIAYSHFDGTNTVIQLKRAFPYFMAADITEKFTLVAGCNHTLEDCTKFGNVVNRRAEDWIPGIESLTRLPTQ